MKILTKEEIFNEAFLLFKKKGLKAVTARGVAEKLSSSTTVIYSHYNSMEELRLELVEKAKEIFLSYVKVPLDDLAVLNMSLGVYKFAKENKFLFNTIFLEKEYFINLIAEIKEILKKEVYKNIKDYDKREKLFEDYWIYVYGLSVFTAKDLIIFTDDEIGERILKMIKKIFY